MIDTLTIGAALLVQGFTMLPNGQMVFTPQPRDFPSPQYYRPEGGPPIGYGVRSSDPELFVPYGGGPTSPILNGDDVDGR